MQINVYQGVGRPRPGLRLFIAQNQDGERPRTSPNFHEHTLTSHRTTTNAIYDKNTQRNGFILVEYLDF